MSDSCPKSQTAPHLLEKSGCRGVPLEVCGFALDSLTSKKSFGVRE